MQYGYFDDKEREYVITRPDTPAPWVNYLGSPEYGAIISNNAGGYSFAQSGANGRILRYVFNQFDQPGRYIYLRDNITKRLLVPFVAAGGQRFGSVPQRVPTWDSVHENAGRVCRHFLGGALLCAAGQDP